MQLFTGAISNDGALVSMSSLRICTGTLIGMSPNANLAQHTLRNTMSYLQGLKNYPLTMTNNMHTQVRQMINEVEQIQRKLVQIDGFVKDSGYIYEQMEHSLNTQADVMSGQTSSSSVDAGELSHTIVQALSNHSIFKKKSKLTAMSAVAAKTGRIKSALFAQGIQATTTTTTSKKSQYGTWKVGVLDTYQDGSHNVNSSMTLRSLVNEGLKASGEFGVHLVGVSRYDKAFGFLNHVEVNVGNAEISGKAHAVLMQDGKIKPELDIDVNAYASAASGLISSKWQNDIIRIKGVVKGDVGVASAKASAKINQDGIDIRGEVGVAAARGEATGTFEFLGVKVTATAQGEAGAVGVGGNFSVGDRSFEIGGKLSCLLGTGLNFKFEW